MEHIGQCVSTTSDRRRRTPLHNANGRQQTDGRKEETAKDDPRRQQNALIAHQPADAQKAEHAEEVHHRGDEDAVPGAEEDRQIGGSAQLKG